MLTEMVRRRSMLVGVCLLFWQMMTSSPSLLCCQAYLPRDSASFFKMGCVCSTMIAATCFQMIESDDEEYIVERLGTYHRSLVGRGIHFIGRPFEDIRYRGTKQHQTIEIPCHNHYYNNNNIQFNNDNDNTTNQKTIEKIPLKANVTFQIINMKEAYYKVHNNYNSDSIQQVLIQLCMDQMKKEIRKLTYQETIALVQNGQLNEILLSSFNLVCHEWGINVTQIDIQPNIIINNNKRNTIPNHPPTTVVDIQKQVDILKSEYQKVKLIQEAQTTAQTIPMNFKENNPPATSYNM